MANYTIIGSDGKEYGPIAAEDVRQWLADGRINAQTKVRAEGTNEWKLISDFSEFSGSLKKNSTPPPLPASPTRSKTSALAITSLVLGVLGLFTCGATALIGLILGVIAIVKIRNSEGRLNGFGLALAGTIVSGVFLLMIPIYAAMLLPALAAAKQRAQEINCVNNEKQLALAVRIYSGDNTNHFPHAATWCDDIKSTVGSEKVFKCPAVDANGRCDYAFNTKLDGIDESKVAPNTVMIFESNSGWNANGGSELMISASRHARMFVVAFADGSVQQVRESQLSTLRWDP
jgi:prepilin-type processing-associated H-X9-DG protein